MTPQTVSNGKGDGANLLDSALNNIDFEIRGQLDSTTIQMEQPLTGQSKRINPIGPDTYFECIEKLRFLKKISNKILLI